MKSWQVIGVILLFIIIGVIELLVIAGTYLDMKYIVEPYKIEAIDRSLYSNIGALTTCLCINFFIALGLFCFLTIKNNGKHLRNN